MINSITVIIRSSGERTLSYCKKLLTLQIPEQQIVVVEEAPFSATLKKSFQIGIVRGLKWTLCIDADVLVKADAVSRLLEHAEKTKEEMFEIQGLVLDKFFPIKRPAGNHLYRTSLMDKAIGCIPLEGESLRPETDTLNKMAELGYPWEQIDVFVGLHDFKQNYSDIYKKCFLQAHKHTWVVPLVEKYWDTKKNNDEDFRVALFGLRSGKIYDKDVFVDRNFLNSETNDVLTLMKIKEKQPLPTEEFLAFSVDEIFNAQNYNAYLNKELQSRIFPLRNWNKIHVIEKKRSLIFEMFNSLKNGLEQTGPWRFAPWIIGKFFQKIGRGICEWSDQKINQ